MHPVIAKTFGGLSKPYYFRQFFFGLLLLLACIMLLSSRPQGVSFEVILWMVANTLLYPYARFIYESAIGFIMGRNVFFVNTLLMMFVKLMTMMLCWGYAVFVAPVGLAYLYYYHNKIRR